MSELELGCIAFIQDELVDFKKLNLPEQKEAIKQQEFLINTVDMSPEMLKCNVTLLHDMKSLHQTEIDYNISRRDKQNLNENINSVFIALAASASLLFFLSIYYG